MTDTPALRPPEKWKHLRWHWLIRDDEYRPWKCVNSYWSNGHEGARIWPGLPNGWRYHGPCDPAAIMPDPKDEAMVKIVAEHMAQTPRNWGLYVVEAKRVLIALRDMAKGGGNG